MPVILAKSDYDRWLNPSASVEDLQGLLQPWGGKLTATEAPKVGAVKAEAEPAASTPEKAPLKKSVAKKPTKMGSRSITTALGGYFSFDLAYLWKLRKENRPGRETRRASLRSARPRSS